MLHCLLVSVFLGMKLVEDVLGYLGLPVGRGAAEVVEIAVEPVVYLFVDLVIVVTDLLRSLALFESLDLGGCALLVCAANVEGIVAHEAAVPGEDVC